jgi:glycosyltransferase involved in cell wall biosynthesis
MSESPSSVKPLVSVLCLTYNHEKFIKEALDGFLMQETNFPVEVIISDDHSSDTNKPILQEYEKKYKDKLILILRDQNIGVMRNFRATLPTCHGKYIALCEGDDYWTDPLKLQKQVEFMEAHPECSIASHKVLHLHEEDSKKNHIFPNIQGNNIFSKEYLYGHYFISTCSIMFRNEKIENLIELLGNFSVGDTPLIYFYAHLGKIGFLDDCMGVYRIHSEGVWSSKERNTQLIEAVNRRRTLQQHFNLQKSKEFNSLTLSYIMTIADNFLCQNKYQSAFKYLGKANALLMYSNQTQRKKLLSLTKRTVSSFLYSMIRN